MSARRPLLLPLVPLYRAGLALKQRFQPAPHRLTAPVISVGSLSAGGAGKTPLVLLLAEILQSNGHTPDILTRGYGRTGTATEQVDPAGTAARFGDEPLLLARRGLPVFVGADRLPAGHLAESTSSPNRVHLLDDGFQHRQLFRNLDIVLLTAQNLADHLLPAGNLREPLSALRRADILVLRSEEADTLRPTVAPFGKEIWTVERRLTLPQRPSRPLVFCGLARPEGFLAMLAAEGITPAAENIFADHHPYTARDIETLLTSAFQAGADSFLTTEKDAVKLTPDLRGRLETLGPLVVAQLHLSFPTPEAERVAISLLTAALEP